MPHRKVYAAAANSDEPSEVVISSEDPHVIASTTDFKPFNKSSNRAPTTSVKSTSRPSSKILIRSCRRLYRRVFRPFTRLYKRLSWTTRETISVSASLVATLYIFFSVPFRVGFYYNPLGAHEPEEVHRWTEELTIFVILDAAADLIGLVEFVGFCQVWKDSFSQLSASVSFELGKKLTRDANRLKVPRPMRRSVSSTGIPRGKAKWTIASIRPLSSVSGGATDDSSFQFKYILARNMEFAMEITALLPVEIIPYASRAYNMLHLVRITKLSRIYRLRSCLVRIANIYSDRAWVQHISSTGIDSLVRNIGVCAGLCHWVACGYMLIAHVQCGVSLEACDEGVETSWVVRDRLCGASVARKYARTVYWASRTMVLLGFDDVTPVSDAETLYTIAAILLGALFGSSLLATFLFIFRFRNARYAAFTTHVDNAREYMRSRNIPRAVRQQVIAYFNYSWSTHHSLDSEEALHLMPEHLQSKVISMLKASRITQVCFLMKESVEFINLLALALVRRVYSPGDQVTEPKFNAQMFFVIRGKVVLSAFDGSNPKNCETGDFFADSCLLFPEKYEEKAVAKTFCELYVLAKVKFDEALTHFHRGDEPVVRGQMTETLEKYSTQLRKTKKLLGLRGGNEGGGENPQNVGSDNRLGDSRRRISWRRPGSIFRVYWETARLLAVVYVAFEVPFFCVFIAMKDDHGMFVDQPEIGVRYALTLLVEVFFAADLVLRSRYFVFLDQSVMLEVVQPSLIFAAYKVNGFYLDLLAWLPIGVVSDSLTANGGLERMALLRLLRLLRVREVPNLLQNISDYHSISSKAYLVISLLLGVTLMLHIVGCLWFEMAWLFLEVAHEAPRLEEMSELTRAECLQQATHFQNCSWIHYDCYANIGELFPLQDPTSLYKSSFAYLRSVYWAIVALTGVGYGDIAAYSTAESYFAAIWIFVGGIINFGVVGAMSSTISNLMATQHHHIEKLNTLNSILERMDVSDKLSGEIRRFYHHQFMEHKHAYESQLLAHLPDHLCYQISSLLHSEAVRSVPLFDSAGNEFLHEVTGKFRHRSYQHGETICLEGDTCREFFVFLHGSKINVFFYLRKVPIRALHDGDCYGVSEFLLRRAYSATLIAASLVHASVMTREQFDAIQRKFADDISDMKEEAQATWKENQERMRCAVWNLEKLKLQPHMMHTPSLFCQHDSAIAPASSSDGKTGKVVAHDVDAARSRFTSTWNAMIACWNFYNALFIIFRICFHSHLHFTSSINTSVWVADLACDFCFAADVYLRVYYFGCADSGFENLLQRNENDKDYLHSSTFKWDLLASSPLYVPASSHSLIASLNRLPRIIRCVDLWVYLDDAIVQIQQHFESQNVSAYLTPIKLFIILVLGAHATGCIFFLVSEYECKYVERCWVAEDHLLEAYHHSMLMLYAKSFYWAITTLLLVGSREGVPRGTAGTLWTGFTCLCCTFIIGYIVGEISEAILELGKEVKEYKSRIASFESFAKEHNLSSTLRERVAFFFRLQFQHTGGLDLHRTVHDLSANLRLKLMHEIYGQPIELLPISHFLSPSQINNLALRLQSELFIPGDNILIEGTFGSRLCILRKGLAVVLWSRSVTSVAVLMEGALFGEIAFFLSSVRRLATVRATTSCEILYVTQRDWQELWATSGDMSDTHVQKHALQAIFDWVHGRLRRYQRNCLRVAYKTKRLLIPDRQASCRSNLPQTASRLPSYPQVGQASETTLLEVKAKYLLSKADVLIARFGQVFTTLHGRRNTTSSKSGHSVRNSVSRNKFHKVTSEMHDATAQIRKNSNTNKSDIHLLQFIVDLNPVNKMVRDYLSNDKARRLEAESWARFKILAAAIGKLLDELILPETSTGTSSGSTSSLAEQRPHIKPRNPIKRHASYSLRHDGTAASRDRLVAPPNKVLVTHKRRFSTVETKQQMESEAISAAATTNFRTRSSSLPMFGSKYFDKLHQEGSTGLKAIEQASRTSIDFDLLQRCQRPQYATQLKMFRRLRRWMSTSGEIILPTPANISTEPKRLQKAPSLRGNWAILDPTGQPSNGRRLSVLGSTFHLASDHAHSIDPQSREMIKRIKGLGIAWDFVMLAVSIYHLIITPFKLCFSHELTELHRHSLHIWSGFEVFLDVLCVIDVGYKIRYASLPLHSMGAALTGPHQGGLRRVLVSNPALRADMLAMLPLELLLFATDVRFPLKYAAPDVEASTVSWWTSRWILRMNRVLLVRRIEPLTEQYFQYLVYDCKLPVDDAMLNYMRGLTSYFTMGHLLACLWYVTSELGFFHYGTSWLSTSGMLIFIPDENTIRTTVDHAARMLSGASTSFDLEHVSLTRKYLRSLLFSMECISTLFYGDILSMNLLELIAEIIITLWSIYIFGALVGAQGELLNARAKQQAAFEQSLGELQHYLVQNGVSKKLKKQIKAYYARLWRRRKGEDEFTAIENVSRALYEDVVLVTLRTFAARVIAFQAFDEHFLRGLLVCLEYVVCSEGEEVAMKGDVDRSMYFIAHGRILVKLDSAESVRERGEFFGELALLYGIARLETCVALTITELYRLDHEPYERLLQDFPEYRYQNRLAWTRPTGSAPDHTVLESIVRNFQKGIRRSVVSFQEPAMSIIPPLDVVANAERINTDLPHSHIYRFIMELLARLHHLSPLEARDLVVQGRTAARKHLKALLGLATSRDEKPHLEMLVPMIDTHEDVSAFQHGDEEANWDKAQDCTEPDGQPSSSSASGRRATVGAFAKQGSRLDVLNV